MKPSIFKFSIISNLIIFLVFHTYGVSTNISTFIQKSSASEISSFIKLNEILLSPVAIYILQFIFILLFISSIFIWLNALFSITFSRFKIISEYLQNKYLAILTWAFISNSVLLILNSAYFQHSNHLPNIFRIWPENHLSILICWIIFLLPFIYFIFNKNIGNKLQATILVIPILILATSNLLNEQPLSKNNHSPDTSKPNIILIGIDSLRSDLLATHMPFLYEELKQSVIFDNSYTELGRTFPAWNTILTGMYPIEHGARVNLLPESSLTNTHHYLPDQLKHYGYRSVFAYDETRFANIGTHQGFDQIISPRMGASDFIIGLISDLPLINLLSLFDVSAFLLPEIYANRAVHVTYRAKSFSSLIENQLPAYNQPSLLAFHFCLAHWPYKFSTQYSPNFNYPQPYYPANLRAVDDQIEQLMTTLKNKGYLESSQIVFLSDHGEAWHHENPAFTSDIEKKAFIRNISGHGSDLVTDTANRVLIAFKNFPNEESLFYNTKKFTSLADITPTILYGLGLHTSDKSGRNLSDPNLDDDKWIPIETGTVFDSKNITPDNVANAIQPLLYRYEINSSGKVVIKENAIPEALKQKRIGIRNNRNIFTQEDNGFYLFDSIDKTYIRYETLLDAKKQQPGVFDTWCKWFSSIYNECAS